MLVTSGCWSNISWWQFLDVSDRISILVTSFGCRWPTLMLKARGCWWQKRPKPSPTSQSCLQHISSPTSVTNIRYQHPSPTSMWPLLWYQIFSRNHQLKQQFWNVHDRFITLKKSQTLWKRYDSTINVLKLSRWKFHRNTLRFVTLSPFVTQ